MVYRNYIVDGDEFNDALRNKFFKLPFPNKNNNSFRLLSFLLFERKNYSKTWPVPLKFFILKSFDR